MINVRPPPWLAPWANIRSWSTSGRGEQKIYASHAVGYYAFIRVGSGVFNATDKEAWITGIELLVAPQLAPDGYRQGSNALLSSPSR